MGCHRKLQVAVVGCGQIADAHLGEIRKQRQAEPVAVCDQFLDLAQQAGERFGITRAFDSVEAMLAEVKADVVHVTTPPHSHFSVARTAIAMGAHVYVEKPFTVTAGEADELLAEAKRHKRLVCVGHDHLFDPCWLELMKEYDVNALGQVVHVDSIQGYDLNGPFGRAMIGDPKHWIHRLPGGLFHNNISHAVYKVTQFLVDPEPRIWASWFGEQGGVPTELRVLLQGKSVSATVVFSSRIRPAARKAIVFGTKRTVEVDFEGRLLRWTRAAHLPGPFAKIETPWRQTAEAARSLLRNAWRFCRSDLQYFAGMNRLFDAFYSAIASGGESPIPPTEIRRVTTILDEIFRSCRSGAEGAPSNTVPDRLRALPADAAGELAAS